MTEPGPPTKPPSDEGGPAASAEPAAAASSASPPRSRVRLILTTVLVVVVLAAAGVVVVVLLNRGDGTQRTANPIEVRRLVAIYPCTPLQPGTPPGLQLTAGQAVVRVPRAGCAVVGEVVGTIDHATKVTSSKSGANCTVTIDSTKVYGAALDHATSVADGQARALVAGGQVLDVRAVVDYPGRPSGAMHVVFTSPDSADCDQVAAALRLM